MADKEKSDFCTMDINMPGIMLRTDAAREILTRHPKDARGLGTIFIQKPVVEKSVKQAIDYFLN